MSDPADSFNTMPLQKINWGGETQDSDSLWERIKKARQIQKIRKGVKVEVHVHLHGKDDN